MEVMMTIYISADLLGVDTGEVVLVTGGTSSRATKETFEKPIDSVIIAKIDKLIFENSEIGTY
ncbi:MAG: EutN/CcmL family microcompartment protein [Actinobacteria bacterium]|nr:EutN/CcmL family microcompartment protein [Actinomycetota bacterium]